MDGKMLSEDEEDEDEQFLVEVPPPSDSPEMDVVSDLNNMLFKYHGKHWIVIYYFFYYRGLHKNSTVKTNMVHGRICFVFFSF